ncbi:unnamed protein product, partial [Effrenium voratum]
ILKKHGPPLHSALIRFFRAAAPPDGSDLLGPAAFVEGLQALGTYDCSGGEVPLLHAGRLYQLFEAIDTNSSGTISFLELLLAMDERSARPQLPEFPALEGSVPATLLVHKAALLRVCRALDPQDTGRISVKNFMELVCLLFSVLGRPLVAAHRRAMHEELSGEAGRLAQSSAFMEFRRTSPMLSSSGASRSGLRADRGGGRTSVLTDAKMSESARVAEGPGPVLLPFGLRTGARRNAPRQTMAAAEPYYGAAYAPPAQYSSSQPMYSPGVSVTSGGNVDPRGPGGPGMQMYAMPSYQPPGSPGPGPGPGPGGLGGPGAGLPPGYYPQGPQGPQGPGAGGAPGVGAGGMSLQLQTPNVAPGPAPQLQVPNREVLYGPPPALTSGLPDPSSVERQKENYLHSLEEQEQRSNASLELQRKQQLELIHTQAEQQKKRLFMQIDQQVKTQEMALTQQYNQQLLQLNQQYHQQKAALEQQAMQLTMEYQQQKMQEEMVKKQMELHKEHSEVQARYQSDLQRLHQSGGGCGGCGQQDPYGPGAYQPPPMQQGPQGGSWVPPPMPNGNYMPPLQPGGGGSYVPPPGGGGGGSYVPPVGMYPDMQVTGGGSYVPPPTYTSSGSYVPPTSLPNGVTQPQVPSYGAQPTMPGFAAPPTTYGPLPPATAYGSASTNYPGTQVSAQ